MNKLFTLGLLLFSATCLSNTPNADDILNQVRDRDDGASFATTVTLRLIGADDSVRDRNMYMLQRDLEAEEERIMMYFHEPADVRGVSFLIANYGEQSEKLDDQWLYLPAFRKTRRIGSNDKRGSFMGSTFNYYDLDKIRVKDYSNTLVGEETILDRPTWLIERQPVSQEVINKTGYHQVKVWIDQERLIPVQYHYFDAKGILFKTQQSVDVQKVDNIWTIMKAEVVNFDKNQRSEMIFNNIKYNVEVPEKQLSQRSLKRGIKDNHFDRLMQTKESE